MRKEHAYIVGIVLVVAVVGVFVVLSPSFTRNQDVISQASENSEQTAKDQFLAFLASTVDTYDITYHREWTTSGSSTEELITLLVTDNTIQSYLRESVRHAAPEGQTTCVKSYSGNQWQSCTCKLAEWCEDKKMVSDAQLKTDVLTFLRQQDLPDKLPIIFLSFAGSQERTCFISFIDTTNTPWEFVACFNDEGLLVNRFQGLSRHPSITYVDGYEAESIAETAWNLMENYKEGSSVIE